MVTPEGEFFDWLHQLKYRQDGETFEEAMVRLAKALGDDYKHTKELEEIFVERRFLPAGRVQAAVGSQREVTPYNCFVMDTIPDSMEGIMRVATEAALSMKLGGGVGFDFSTLRHQGALIKSIQSESSGPISFMEIYNAICKTVKSAGHRRGAMMAVLRVDHPDIEHFIRCKRNGTDFTNFNISVAVTDEFMQAVQANDTFHLRFDGETVKTVRALDLWKELMQSTWDWAEPGVLFIDTINRMNNLWYCEDIAATNPCGEQPLPPYGTCLLGSFNMTQYMGSDFGGPFFNVSQFRKDIPHVVRAMDNVIDLAKYPLEAQQRESHSKRRLGLGVTGMANMIEYVLGGPCYGSGHYVELQDRVLELLTLTSYKASVELAKEKGSFPLYDERYRHGEFISCLPEELRKDICWNGIRNSHLTSIAPAGTISMTAGNVSSGIEPVFHHTTRRKLYGADGEEHEVQLNDYGYEKGIQGKVAEDCTIGDHKRVLIGASRWIDSAVSKTCNVSLDTPWEEFEYLYWDAWEAGVKGCTTYTIGGKRAGIMEGEACYIGEDGQKHCE